MELQGSILISFSGMDGAGKSTQIASLRAWLEARGHRVHLLAFWDDVVVLSRLREGFVHRVFKSERGIGAPGKPVRRRDKNVRAWYLTLFRAVLYLLDAVNLRRVVARERQRTDVLILDRYIYDELANLPAGSGFTARVVRLATAIVPQPDIAFLLDAEPEAAVLRKPEYPLEFQCECREAYLKIAEAAALTVVPPLPLEAATSFVAGVMQRTVADQTEDTLTAA